MSYLIKILKRLADYSYDHNYTSATEFLDNTIEELEAVDIPSMAYNAFMVFLVGGAMFAGGVFFCWGLALWLVLH